MSGSVNQNNVDWTELFPYLELIEKGTALKLNWSAPTCISNFIKSSFNDVELKQEKNDDIRNRKDYSEFDFEDDSLNNPNINMMRKSKAMKPKAKPQYKTNLDKILNDLSRKKREEKDEITMSRISPITTELNIKQEQTVRPDEYLDNS